MSFLSLFLRIDLAPHYELYMLASFFACVVIFDEMVDIVNFILVGVGDIFIPSIHFSKYF